MQRTVALSVVLLGAYVAACGGSDGTVVDAAGEPTTPTGGVDPATGNGPPGANSIIADLRADTNRDGVVRFDDPADDDGEESWNEKHGAVFLANIDDDEERCELATDDVDLPKCNDAADDVVNGPEDAKDLAKLATRPWADAPDGTSARISTSAAERVRLFRKEAGNYTPLADDTVFEADAVRSGIELAIEARDIVRDAKTWDGYVDIKLALSGPSGAAEDVVRMRVSPVMTYHHLSPAETTYVSTFSSTGNAAMRADLVSASTAAGVAAPKTISTQDPWTEDFFETAYMSMPAEGGKQHVVRVNIRSANEYQPQSSKSPLRRAGRFAFMQRGRDSAAIQQFDPARGGKWDTLNSFGNLETIPPFTHAGQSFPLGRVLRGSVPSYYPDKAFAAMMEAQAVQPAVNIDTSWLLVAHVDETLSFVKAPTARGWVLLANDPTLAKTMLETQVAAGNGDVRMFVGKRWSAQETAEVSINDVLADTEVMSESAQAAVEVDAQLAIIKDATGLTDAEIIRVPFLHYAVSGRSVAYQPGTVNGLYLSDKHFVAPKPHGPVIAGKDIFEEDLKERLSTLGITVHFAENWDSYHRNLGEVHCGTNATRQVPDAKWWETGR